jgi:excisionase family DNA binding protein
MPALASRYLTPPGVAERLGVDSHRVVGWIRSGQLPAVNVGDGARRPRFRVSEADLAAFLAARSVGPAPRVSRIRRRRDSQVTEFF